MNKKSLLSEVAIERMFNYMFNIADTDEMLRRIGIQRHQLKQLEFDDEVMQCKQTCVDAVTGTDWHVEPFKGKAAKFITELLKKHLNGMLVGCMESIAYGYSVQETIYVKDGSMIVPERVSVKPMQWFTPQPDGTLRYFPADSRYTSEGILCDPRKFLLAVNRGSYENPRGEALMSRLWFPVTNRREGWGLWLSFMETFSQPIIIGKVPNFQEFVNAMVAQGIRSAIGWQSSSDRDEITTISASSPGEFDRLEAAIIKRIQKLWLGQTMTSDTPAGGGGSYASAAVGNRVREDKLLAHLQFMTVLIQRWIDMVLEINNLQPVQFVLANGAGLEQARATRDALLYPVLQSSGLKLSKTYFLNCYDYKEGDIEEVEIPEPLDQDDDPNEEGNAVKKKPKVPNEDAPVKDESVTDED